MGSLQVKDVRCHLGDSGFLLDDGTTAILLDTGFGFTGFSMAEKIRKHLGTRSLDYIFLTHSHYDHALGSAYILRSYPTAKVVAGAYAARIFKRSGAIETMRRLDSGFALQNGITDYTFLGHELRVDLPVKDGDSIKAGTMSFEVLELPGHTKCSIGFYDKEQKLLLSPETIGVYDGEAIIFHSILTSASATLRSIERILSLGAETIVTPHYGLLSSAQASYFLSHVKEACEFSIQETRRLLEEGKPTEEIVEAYKDTYWKGYVKAIYPLDAIVLNTSIMVEVIKREMQ